MAKTTTYQRDMRRLDAYADALSLHESAALAYAERSKIDFTRARDSFASQMFTRLKLRQDEDYVVDPVLFDGEFWPDRQMGTEIEGVTFCLRDGQLAIVVWRCGEVPCLETKPTRFAIKDWASLGAALEASKYEAERRPLCEAHAADKKSKKRRD